MQQFLLQVINEDADQLNELMQDIEQSVQDGKLEKVTTSDIIPGAIYLAEFEDGGWYRGRVLGKIKVNMKYSLLTTEIPSSYSCRISGKQVTISCNSCLRHSSANCGFIGNNC